MGERAFVWMVVLVVEAVSAEVVVVKVLVVVEKKKMVEFVAFETTVVFSVLAAKTIVAAVVVAVVVEMSRSVEPLRTLKESPRGRNISMVDPFTRGGGAVVEGGWCGMKTAGYMGEGMDGLP